MEKECFEIANTYDGGFRDESGLREIGCRHIDFFKASNNGGLDDVYDASDGLCLAI